MTIESDDSCLAWQIYEVRLLEWIVLDRTIEKIFGEKSFAKILWHPND